jgi:hypothetical protein
MAQSRTAEQSGHVRPHTGIWETSKNLNSILEDLRCAKHWTTNFGEPYRGRSAADYSDLLKETIDFGARLWDMLTEALEQIGIALQFEGCKEETDADQKLIISG